MRLDIQLHNSNIHLGSTAIPTYIKGDRTSDLITELAQRRGLTKQEAVEADLASDPQPMFVLDKFKKLWAEHPVPPPTGEIADKAFFDELSGEDERE